MKLPVFDKTGKEISKKDMPKQFSEPVRADLIYKAVLTVQANSRQPYGANPDAGMMVSAKLSRRRRDWKGSYGIGIARSPRKIMSHRGTRFNWVGALAPNTVGGRRAHPPKADRIWDKKLNTKERRKAIRSALAATMHKDLVKTRGHLLPASFPFILSDDVQNIKKTKDVVDLLIALGFGDELARTKDKVHRAGVGKNRGRPYKIKKSVLFVVGKKSELNKAAENISGVDIVTPEHLNAELLAPGCSIGRLTLYTESAIDEIAKKFM
ncbi:MAG TPA: 50S ribosomal protein L4 [Alphaproteobacteria bacterium]|nr:50S ribosomal protein L4 [Alphaproteobacteria bacterium]